MKRYWFCLVMLLPCLMFLAGCDGGNIVEAYSKNVTNYDITAELNYDDKTLSATEVVKYINKTDCCLNEICFHLYPNAFRQDADKCKAVSTTQFSKAYTNGFSEGKIDILRVLIGNDSVEYEINGEDCNILSINLPSELKQNCVVEIDISFNLLIPNCNHRFGYGDNTLNLGNWYPIVCVFEDDNWVTSGYSSNGDPFYSEISNYNVRITYPNDLILASTGNEVSTSLYNDSLVSIYKANAVRDFAMVLSSKFNIVSNKVNDTTINYYYYDDENYESNLKTACDALNSFNDMIGEYPYNVLNVVKVNFLQGGMEYPNLVYVSDTVTTDSDYKNVIVHEIAHQWWYGLVGNNECEYAWLDEGLTEYVTALFYDLNDGYELTTEKVLANALSSYLLFCDVYREVYGDLDSSMSRSIYEYNTETEYVYMTYVKSVLMFDSISELIGENKMSKCLKLYYKNNIMQNATPAKLIEIFGKASQKNLSSYIMSWLDGSVVLEELSR